LLGVDAVAFSAGQSARLAATGLEILRRYGIDNAVLVANYIEALLATGDWDEADRASAAALRTITASYPYMLLMLRADLELGRGDFEAARARRDAAAAGAWLARAGTLIAVARDAAAEAAAVTPNAAGWLALAEAEAERARGAARPERWSDAADAWQRLERPPLAAYCRWRQAEALVAAGASRAAASRPLTAAHAVAARIGAKPLAAQLELLARRARLELTSPDPGPPDQKQGLEELLDLTPREAEVLTLLAQGCTNREIAATLVISVRTAGVHVSHILRKLSAPNRLEAAAIAHRLYPGPP
jgi:DNA-binding NarL/FixJ family response regulator